MAKQTVTSKPRKSNPAAKVDMSLNFEGIRVKGAREHNLKDVSLSVPRNQLTVITGLSGSGKSSMAFDIIFAEGQRRYIESLSSYARNFMEQLKKPEVESIHGLSPSIAIDQKSVTTNPRSTVGTMTEVYDFMRLLYAKVGTPKCPEHGIPVESQTPKQILQDIMKRPKGSKFLLTAPMVRDKKGEYLAEFQKWIKKGFTRAKIDGKWVELEKAKKLAKHKRHNIDLLIDRLVVDEKFKTRLSESINLSLEMARGQVSVETVGGEIQTYSIHSACPTCGYGFPELEPRYFSFNNPRGACPECDGLGSVDYEYTSSEENEEDETWIDAEICEACQGERLKPEVLNVVLQEKNIAELSRTPVDELLEFFKSLKLNARDSLIADKIVAQITSRLEYMVRVGTGYLTLDRATRTLSGGETQRIRLATQVGSSLVGVLYVLDEPSIGLHPRDHHRLLKIIQEIKERGNTILLVEHDEDTIRAADHIIDFGPGAGVLGGEVVASGTVKDIENCKESITGDFLAGRKKIPIPVERRKGNGAKLSLIGASGNNLNNVTLNIPLGTLCGVTGVSGSGKSTLIFDTLYRALAHEFYDASAAPAPFQEIVGLENIDKVININQKPIGRTPRSTPATYVGLFPLIRGLYAGLPEAKIRGYKPGHFSFNVKGGRCEVCQGAGQIRMEMHFLSDVFVECDSCAGKRYAPEILSVRFKDKSIADVLQMTVGEAAEFFTHHKQIYRKLDTLRRVGLDYISLGQSSTTISGGEAQRVKLSKELSKRGTGKTLYILDEPTTGLHFEDIRKLVELLHELVDNGNTVLVIEHHMDVIKNCDHLIDLGPDGGRNGGNIVGEGPPEKIAKIKTSETGKFL